MRSAWPCTARREGTIQPYGDLGEEELRTSAGSNFVMQRGGERPAYDLPRIGLERRALAARHRLARLHSGTIGAWGRTLRDDENRLLREMEQPLRHAA
jgi:hypothetical protein